jgi:hypothetical protein
VGPLAVVSADFGRACKYNFESNLVRQPVSQHWQQVAKKFHRRTSDVSSGRPLDSVAAQRNKHAGRKETKRYGGHKKLTGVSYCPAYQKHLVTTYLALSIFSIEPHRIRAFCDAQP